MATGASGRAKAAVIAAGGRRASEQSGSRYAGPRLNQQGRLAGSAGSAGERAAIIAALAALDAQRRAIGCSQETLARALGVNRAIVSRLLRGEAGTRGVAATLATREGLRRVELALLLLARAAAQPAAGPATQSARANGPRGVAAARSLARGFGGAQDESRTANTRTVAAAGRYRVLIAEDDPDTVTLYNLVLSDPEECEVYDLTIARSAGACLDALAAAAADRMPFDLLLMDLGIGDVRIGNGGATLLRELSARRELLPPRVLVVSGVSPYQLEHKRAELTALGASYLPKPFDIDDLAAAVRALCRRNGAPLQAVRAFA